MKKIFIFGLISVAAISAQAQKNSKPGRDWYQNSTTKDTMGIGVKKAYAELLKDKKATEIVVAVIDGGTDIEHPDLQANIWHNPGEIPFNNIDDDHNGYTDDTVGWNFIGGSNGAMVEFDNLEKVRVMLKMEKEFDGVEAEDVEGDPARKTKFEKFNKLKQEIENEWRKSEQTLKVYNFFIRTMDDMRAKSGREEPRRKDIKKYPVTNPADKYVKKMVLKAMKKGTKYSEFYKELSEGKEQLEVSVKYNLNVNYNARKIVGDNYENQSERYYGNNNVDGPDAAHGTHVAGIIAAVRNNNYGMNGIADHAKIMVVRVVPHGDERDKDVANGIRYAVDNGAKIINMSFGKEYSWNKKIVDSAVAYAVSKGVLLIHAAGNDNKNIDVATNYPNDSIQGGSFAESWLEVGASALNRKRLAASFSNYGKHNVDVFAPGYQIYSTTPDEKFEYFDGTSMAAPVTSGVAALVWSYYPTLTAVQLKTILMESAMRIDNSVAKPGGGKISFNELSVTGGLINAYSALLLAAKTVK